MYLFIYYTFHMGFIAATYGLFLTSPIAIVRGEVSHTAQQAINISSFLLIIHKP